MLLVGVTRLSSTHERKNPKTDVDHGREHQRAQTVNQQDSDDGAHSSGATLSNSFFLFCLFFLASCRLPSAAVWLAADVQDVRASPKPPPLIC